MLKRNEILRRSADAVNEYSPNVLPVVMVVGFGTFVGAVAGYIIDDSQQEEIGVESLDSLPGYELDRLINNSPAADEEATVRRESVDNTYGKMCVDSVLPYVIGRRTLDFDSDREYVAGQMALDGAVNEACDDVDGQLAYDVAWYSAAQNQANSLDPQAPQELIDDYQYRVEKDNESSGAMIGGLAGLATTAAGILIAYGIYRFKRRAN